MANPKGSSPTYQGIGATHRFAKHVQSIIKVDYATAQAKAKAFLNGTVMLADLPTSDPLVAGQIWNNAGTPTTSAG